jgi:hypothetical protein
MFRNISKYLGGKFMRSIKLIVVAISILVSTIAISATGHPSATTNADNKLGKKP